TVCRSEHDGECFYTTPASLWCTITNLSKYGGQFTHRLGFPCANLVLAQAEGTRNLAPRSYTGRRVTPPDDRGQFWTQAVQPSVERPAIGRPAFRRPCRILAVARCVIGLFGNRHSLNRGAHCMGHRPPRKGG